MRRYLKLYLFCYLLVETSSVYAMDEEFAGNDVLASQFGLSVAEYLQQRDLYAQFSREPQPSDSSDDASDLEQALAKSLGLSVTEFQHQKLIQRDADLAREYARTEKALLDTDEASLALALKLQEEELVDQPKLILHVNELSREFARSDRRPILENFMGIFRHLSTIPQNSDVHILDNYVFQGGNNINHLVNIGNLYHIDNPTLTLATIGNQMIEFVQDNAGLFENYRYDQNPVAVQNILAHLTSHFQNMDNEVSVCPAAREIWSRAWTLALRLYKESHNFDYMKIIFDQALEGHLTRGGCIQGRINRGFIGYVTLLGRAGVGIHD